MAEGLKGQERGGAGEALGGGGREQLLLVPVTNLGQGYIYCM